MFFFCFLYFSLFFFSFGTVLSAEESTTVTSIISSASVDLIQDSSITLQSVTVKNEIVKTEDSKEVNKIDSGDTAWVLLGAILVLMMTLPALAIFYGGMVRKKNLLSTLAYSLGATIVASILWVLFLYSTTFGGKELIDGVIGGFDKMFLDNVQLNGAYGSFAEQKRAERVLYKK